MSHSSIPPITPTDFRFSLPEVIWLEPEDFEEARAISHQGKSEENQWYSYLNVLGLLGFERWFSTRLAEQPINLNNHYSEIACHLKVGEFKFCLIASEHLLDEVVSVPQDVMERAELISHFYVVLEVSEEQEEVLIRGFLHYDKLREHCSSKNLQDGYYHLPLSLFDAEPNHLVHYCHYLEPNAIPLPASSTEHLSEKLQEYVSVSRTKLSQWLQGIFEESWQVMETFINPETNLAFTTRNMDLGAKRAKLIDFGIQLGNQSVAMLVNITAETDEKMGVLVQLHPTGGERFLPTDIRLTLLSKAGKKLQEVVSRSQDNYIQLKPFRGESGKCFSIEVSLENASIKENFEL
ncbi:MAG: DUF1822 family protein [Scytonema sp. PMC 1069.18]|nr:DUF1822 family protein [Scytonema sp. PMC 1069.18]MEC4884027.1 DUF1822 family protein [Scytonema sp. PMC 1070.18]